MRWKGETCLSFNNFFFLLDQSRLLEIGTPLIEIGTLSFGKEWVAFFETFLLEEKGNCSTFKDDQLSPTEQFSREATKENGNFAVLLLLDWYQRYGHLYSTTNPLHEDERRVPNFERTRFSCILHNNQKGDQFPTCGILSQNRASLVEIQKKLQEVYSGNLSYECYNIENKELEEWFHHYLLTYHRSWNVEEKKRMVMDMWKVCYVEKFLHAHFFGAKRFSISGAESLVFIVKEIIRFWTEYNFESIIFGMPHRGRINMLGNVFSKPYWEIFYEFLPKSFPDESDLHLFGDVKYHNEHISCLEPLPGRSINCRLLFSPSHLESINPVLLGIVRAGGEKTLGVNLHGDYALCGEGVVYESLQFAQLPGYCVGGTIHIAINNHLGYTGTAKEGRSTRYCTDIAKAFGIPIIHVNGQDPFSCIKAAHIACEVRRRFHSDVFIDYLCYRRFGHDETDEPLFTSPLMYKKIEQMETPYHNLSKVSEASEKWEVEMKENFHKELERAMCKAKQYVSTIDYAQLAEKYRPGFICGEQPFISLEKMMGYVRIITKIPEGFFVHPKLQKLLTQRRSSLESNITEPRVDWASGELLAYAALLDQGISVRISGQDTRRGAFSHRHAVFFDQENEETFIPLEHVSENQGRFEIYNSTLSEMGAMGFEFGYSIGKPNALVIWEAEFGDFANCAQVMIDQYLASAALRWGVHSGLTLFLPHGLENMGAEHSSCRLERFLSLSALENWRVICLSNSAQMFHILRHQGFCVQKQPLILLTPKSMLRLSSSFSTVEDLLKKSFQKVIDDPTQPRSAEKIILCMGKLYYELHNARETRKKSHVAIVRVEQLYPFPQKDLQEIFAKYPRKRRYIWVQEEPQNQGAWFYMKEHFSQVEDKILPLEFVGRRSLPLADTGWLSLSWFQQQQNLLIAEALT